MIYYSALSEKHDTGNHPENQERMNSILRYLKNKNIEIKKVKDKANLSDLETVHSMRYIMTIKELSQIGVNYGDNVFVNGTFDAALNAAETTWIAVKNNGFAIVRPPGHHASREKFEGFCFFNNVAYGTKMGIKNQLFHKPLIIDLDVHYGNGTAAIFKNDNRVFYLSLHLDPLTIYPGVPVIETPTQKGVNVSKNTDDEEYLKIFSVEFQKALDIHKPDKIIVSMGFDTFYFDPLVGLNIKNTETYRKIGEIIRNSGIPTSAVLEGGYNLQYLGECVYQFSKGLNLLS